MKMNEACPDAGQSCVATMSNQGTAAGKKIDKPKLKP